MNQWTSHITFSVSVSGQSLNSTNFALSKCHLYHTKIKSWETHKMVRARNKRQLRKFVKNQEENKLKGPGRKNSFHLLLDVYVQKWLLLKPGLCSVNLNFVLYNWCTLLGIQKDNLKVVFPLELSIAPSLIQMRMHVTKMCIASSTRSILHMQHSSHKPLLQGHW